MKRLYWIIHINPNWKDPLKGGDRDIQDKGRRLCVFQVKGDADTLSFLREEVKTERDQEPMRGRNTAPEIEKGEKQGFSLKHHVH